MLEDLIKSQQNNKTFGASMHVYYIVTRFKIKT